MTNNKETTNVRLPAFSVNSGYVPRPRQPEWFDDDDEDLGPGWGSPSVEVPVSLLFGEPDAKPEPASADEERDTDQEHGQFLGALFGGGEE